MPTIGKHGIPLVEGRYKDTSEDGGEFTILKVYKETVRYIGDLKDT